MFAAVPTGSSMRAVSGTVAVIVVILLAAVVAAAVVSVSKRFLSLGSGALVA